MHSITTSRGKLDLSTPKIMGILNITPDSFYDGGMHEGISRALDHAYEMIEQGVDILDIGGQSTRPTATFISAQEELDRVALIVEAIRNYNQKIIISIDTFYSQVADECVQLGADIINDISAGQFDKLMLPTVAQLQVPYIMMHVKGTVETMHFDPKYDDVVEDVFHFFEEKIKEVSFLGIKNIIIDPGFGFGKNIKHNYLLLQHLARFKELNYPILAGLSRKSMIYKTLNVNPDRALNGTTVLNTLALVNGANILRVHDVQEAKEVITLVHNFMGANN
jgi:dihydropteroate synthase